MSIQPPKKLYKYLPLERLDVLGNRLIRFSQPSALNDPFELKPVFEDLLPEESIQEALEPSLELLEEALRADYEKLSQEQKAIMSVEQCIKIVTSDSELLRKMYKEFEPQLRQFLGDFRGEAKSIIVDVLNKHVGMLSLSEIHNSHLLWSHYASAHRGFVIEFDTDNDFFYKRRSENDELNYLRKVNYCDRDERGRTLMDLDGNDILLTKGTSWAYEREWRILFHLKNASQTLTALDDEIYLFEYPPEIVSKVIIGAKASKELKNAVSEHLSRQFPGNVEVCEATLDMGTQRVVI